MEPLKQLKKQDPRLVMRFEYECSKKIQNGHSCKFMANGTGNFIVGQTVTPGQCWDGICRQLCVRGNCFTKIDICLKYDLKNNAIGNVNYNIFSSFVHYKDFKTVNSINFSLTDELTLDMFTESGKIINQKYGWMIMEKLVLGEMRLEMVFVIQEFVIRMLLINLKVNENVFVRKNAIRLRSQMNGSMFVRIDYQKYQMKLKFQLIRLLFNIICLIILIFKIYLILYFKHVYF